MLFIMAITGYDQAHYILAISAHDLHTGPDEDLH